MYVSGPTDRSPAFIIPTPAFGKTPLLREGVTMATISTPSPHRIGIMISGAGRLLQCSVCNLSYAFPDNVQFGTVAKQFALFPCSPPILRPGSRVAEIVNARQSAERCLLILRYDGRIPVMASCAKCERKFFTPTTFSRDAISAEEYIRQRFDA